MIVHIAVGDKFITPFVQFIESHFDSTEHLFLISPLTLYKVKPRANVVMVGEHMSRFRKMAVWTNAMNKADKIILHGIFDIRIVNLLCLQPWLLKKCYWIMWGGDLYRYKLRGLGIRSDIQEAKRAFVIKRIGHLVSHVRGDFELAQKWYGATGQYHECFMYPSNLYKEYEIPEKQGTSINILLGNSADPSNNHFELLDQLVRYKYQDILVYCPLSYGDAQYAERVIKQGQVLFGGKFIPLRDFMPFEKYLELLGQIDVGIFAHKRQQGMGNITTLLGLGKKVYMRSDVTSWKTFEQLGVRLYDVNEIEMTRIEAGIAKRNQEIISSYFSERKLIKQWEEICCGGFKDEVQF